MLMLMTIDKDFALTTAISPKAKNLYLILLTYAQDQTSCFPSVDKLSGDLAGSEKTTRRALNELKEIGLIKVYRASTNLKGNNNYILIPTEWVDYITKYTEKDYNISEDEFNALKDKIVAFHEANGIKDLHPELVEETETKAKKVKRTTKPPKTLETRYEEVKAKVAKNPDYQYNSADCVVIFAKLLQDKKGQTCNLRSVQYNKLMKDKIVGAPNDYIELFLETYINMYDSTFRTERYPDVGLLSLHKDWIFNKVYTKVQAIKETTNNKPLELLDVVY